MKTTRIYKGIEITKRTFVSANGVSTRFETETASSNTLKGIKEYINFIHK